jgi:streptogramin lyase
VAGPDGNLWFTEFLGDRIGRITPSGTINEYSVPTTPSGPSGIAVGPDGNLWFTEGVGNVAYITTAGVFKEFALVPTGDPVYITAAPDGYLWLSEQFANRVVRVDPGRTLAQAPPHAPPARTGVTQIGSTTTPPTRIPVMHGTSMRSGIREGSSAPLARLQMPATGYTGEPDAIRPYTRLI